MAVRTREEILESLKTVIGDEPDDNKLSILEDVTDTLSDYERKTADQTDWKTKYEENEASWRKKYTDRFYEKQPEGADDNIHKDDPKPLLHFEDLFTTE